MIEINDNIIRPIDNDAIIERIKYLMDSSPNVRSQSALAKRIGMDPSNFSKHLTGRLPVSMSLINRLVADMGVSKDWLVSGEGIPYPRSEHAVPVNDVRIINPSGGIPVYDVDVTAGCAPLEPLLTDDRVIGHVGLPRINPDAFIVRVTGDSMEPRIIDGGYIAIRKIQSLSNIFWGQIYVIVMDEYRMVKFLRRHPQDNSMVILHSENPAYDDMDVARDDIRALFLVESIINVRNVC